MFNEKLDDIVSAIEENYYGIDEIFFTDPDWHFPSRSGVVGIVDKLRRLMFPRYFGDEVPTGAGPQYFIGDMLSQVERDLHRELTAAFTFRDGHAKSAAEIDGAVRATCSDFFYKLPELQRTLMTDVQAAFDGDPAAQSKEEIIFSYPGFFAVFVYRIAHEFYVHDVPLVPRIMSEYAHSITGVDINPGAQIDEYFFIDHAAGVVIGETCVIGKHVIVYQGVTLGATSTRGGQKLKGVKRHPTIEDGVVIYSNASVLGGDTVVGEGSVIGGSAFLTKSVAPHSRVSVKNQEVRIAAPRA